MRLRWVRSCAGAREAVFIANCILGMRKSNCMHQKSDTISGYYRSGTTKYLKVVTGKELDTIFPGYGISPDTPLAVMYQFLHLRQLVSAKIGVR